MSTIRVRAIFAVAILLILGEALTRWSDQRHNYDPNVLAKIKTGTPSLRGFGPLWYEGEHHETIRDSRGRAFPFTPTRTRIVCLGGSTTEGAPGNDYPGFLAERLPAADVINAGVAAYSTAQTLSTLALNALAWSPDIVVVNHAINDQTAAYFHGFVPDYEHKFMAYGPAGDARRFATPLNTIFQGSHLYWWLQRIPRRLELWYRFGAWRGTAVKNADPQVSTRPYGMAPPAEPLAVFRRNLETLAAIARGRVGLVLITQPYSETATHWHEMLAWRKDWNERAVFPPPNEMAAHHRAYNDVVRQVAVTTGATLVDAEAVITDPGWFLDSVHLTPDGNRRLADAVLAALY